jgi:hypothetical protein
MAVTIADITKIFPTTLTNDQLQFALDTAQMIVSEQLTGVSGCNMSTDRLDKITIYLAAHFAEGTANAAEGIPAVGLKRSKLGEADESYAVPVESLNGYNTTRWGQLALALDTCGILAGSLANGGLKARFEVVNPSESGSYARIRY